MDDAHDFAATRHAMAAFGMGPDAQEGVLRLVAAVLHLGNVEFVPSTASAEEASLAPGAEEGLAAAAELLGLPAADLLRVLTTRVRVTPDGEPAGIVSVGFACIGH